MSVIGVGKLGRLSRGAVPVPIFVLVAQGRAESSGLCSKIHPRHRKMQNMASIERTRRSTLLGRTNPVNPLGVFLSGGESDGKPGDGGGEKTRWSNVKRDEVEEMGALS